VRYARLLGALVVVGAASAPALTISCGPSCLDDRCSLKPATPQTTRVDYTAPRSTTSSSPGTVTSGSGSAAPVVAAGSGSGAGSSAAPVVAAAGSGSAKPAAGSGSATPPKPVVPVAPVATSASWELYSGNQFRMYVVSKASFAAGTKLALDFVKTPAKTPFVVTLETLGNGPEAVWNECPENKIRCDSAGAKTHTVKKAGLVMLQAGINWAVTSVADEANGTLVTWTNNLSREVFSLRLSK
jgi:hypothetical protein